MNSQRKKNIRLMITLAIMIALTIVTAMLLEPADQLDVDRDLFKVIETDKIDQVMIDDVVLTYGDNLWVVNNQYKADPQRIKVLFAILQQVKVRRKVSARQRDPIKAGQPKEIALLHRGEVLRKIYVWGNAESGLTYMSDGDDDLYLVEIPGYRSYLAGIFQLDANEWRYPIVFDINWSNLARVQVDYPGPKDNALQIMFDNNTLILEGVKSDSSKLEDYVNDISLLYVNDYLTQAEVDSMANSTVRATFTISDIAGNQYYLEVYNQQGSEYLVLIDSTEYALMDATLVKRVTKPRAYFTMK